AGIACELRSAGKIPLHELLVVPHELAMRHRSPCAALRDVVGLSDGAAVDHAVADVVSPGARRSSRVQKQVHSACGNRIVLEYMACVRLRIDGRRYFRPPRDK